MTAAEDALWGLRQGGQRLERYVSGFLELSNRVSWHDTALGACFLLGLDDEIICCALPMGDFPLIELINLVLFLNSSDMDVEGVMRLPKSRHPTPAGMCHVSPAHPTPRTSTYPSNGSYRLPNSKFPVVLRSSAGVFSPGAPGSPQSRWPANRKSSPPDVHVALVPVPTPQKRFAVPALPECPPVPAPHKRYLDPLFSPGRAPVFPLSPGRAPDPQFSPGRAPDPQFCPGRSPAPELSPVSAPAPELAPVSAPAPELAPEGKSAIMDMALPPGFSAPVLTPEAALTCFSEPPSSPSPPRVRSSSPSSPSPPLVPSSSPSPPLVPSNSSLSPSHPLVLSSPLSTCLFRHDDLNCLLRHGSQSSLIRPPPRWYCYGAGRAFQEGGSNVRVMFSFCSVFCSPVT
ncbi:vegetative cell wall protein gp1-like isoform X2 [Sinocyclocheilus grahami]|uniref:vegetative cell wall protein gp1-like isoform X2 n=1 Tax=Sinocyclocheilus grahami TaxID=75366 RepID=UPI0007ACBA0F|nr:PREDICTED: vegetative cell wall protein gp1-like isoform X2 [Sinocyclocheilus grahami]